MKKCDDGKDRKESVVNLVFSGAEVIEIDLNFKNFLLFDGKI